MYRQHFGLREKPFRVVPSPRFLFASETHDENRARVLYGIREDRGFVVVSGGIGLGKTTVLLSVLDQLDENTRTALIFNPVDDFRQLLRMICHELDLDPADDDEVELMRRLNLFLVERLALGEKCVLIIDEAQNLPIDVLEKIRTLSNLQTEELSLLQIVLVGQPELREKLDDPRLLQLRQRIGVWHELSPLSREETRSYIWHRLRLAGAPMAERIIIDEACHRIHEISEGTPRLINQICDTAMVVAYGRGDESVEVVHVEEAGRELQLLSSPAPPKKQRDESPSKRSSFRWPSLRLPWRPVAAIMVLTLLLSGAARYDRWWPWFSSELAHPVQDSPEASTAEIPAPMPMGASETIRADAAKISEIVLEKIGQRQESVELLRKSGRPLFAVYLASFRSAAEAQDYVQELCQKDSDWQQPFYVERTSGNPPWYRVLAGGFVQRDEAQRCLRRIRQGGAVSFAKLDRLPRDASPVSLGGPIAPPEEEHNEQHS